MPQCPKLQDMLEHLYDDIFGIEVISVLNNEGLLLCRFPDKEKDRQIPDLSELFRNSGPSETDDISGVILKGKNHFLARYAVPGMEMSLCIYGRSSVSYGLLNSGARNACSRIRDMLYVPED